MASSDLLCITLPYLIISSASSKDSIISALAFAFEDLFPLRFLG
jgi:hypothetical protein